MPVEQREERLGLKEAGERLLAVASRLAEARSRAGAVREETKKEREEEEEAFSLRQKALEDEDRRDEDDVRIEGRAGKADLERARDARLERIGSALERLARPLTEELDRVRQSSASEIGRVRTRLTMEDEARRDELEDRIHRWGEMSPRIRERYEKTAQVLAEFAAIHGVRLSKPAFVARDVDPDVDPDDAASAASSRLEGILSALRAEGRRRSLRLARRGHLLLYVLLLLAAGGAAVAVEMTLGSGVVVAGATGAAVVVGSILMAIVGRFARRRFGAMMFELASEASEAVGVFERQAEAALKRLDGLCVESTEAYRERLAEAESEERRKSRELAAPATEAIEALKKRADALEWRVLARHGERLDALSEKRREAKARRQNARAEAAKHLDADHRHRLDEIESQRREAEEDLERLRREALDEVTGFAAAAREAARGRDVPWDAVDPGRVALPREFPRVVPFASLAVSSDAELSDASGEERRESELRMPALLSFPSSGSLLIRHSGGGRMEALDIVQNALLRVLTSFPAGKARLRSSIPSDWVRASPRSCTSPTTTRPS